MGVLMEFDIGKIVLENELTISDLELDVIKTPTNVTEKNNNRKWNI